MHPEKGSTDTEKRITGSESRNWEYYISIAKVESITALYAQLPFY